MINQTARQSIENLSITVSLGHGDTDYCGDDFIIFLTDSSAVNVTVSLSK